MCPLPNLAIEAKIVTGKVYNTNLTLLLLFLPIPSIVGSSMYSVKDFTHAFGINTTCSDFIIDTVLDMGMSGGVLNLPNLIVDRVAATIYSAQYETKGGQVPWVALSLITTQILLTAGFVALIKTYILTAFAATMIFTTICISSGVLFGFLPRFSRKLHDYHRKRQSSVSIRYQSVENLKAAKLLKVLVAIYVCFYLSETVIFYIFFFIVTDEMLRTSLSVIFNITVIIEILTSIVVVARSHPSLRRALPLFCRRQEVQATYVNTSGDVRSYDGRPLSFSGNCQRDIYFKKLNEFWNQAKLRGV
ncbi:hypothetical protein Y032_0238g3283 [Ancylostoma ceylanicum]|uniref:7TM GPCR serpentine receptor class x (Srx) domain-containing protein n=1 Tax=Ancylostoma ceylanicum TaxID=53326 RepID=A0A016SE56_9BILA|nr:hypothetical protein Y032_0238g3283 [Ancylostoma ceylanicum]